MKILIEGVTPQRDSQKREYYLFSVRFMVPGSIHWILAHGWRFWPESAKLATPSNNKGNNKYINTAKVPIDTYNEIREQIAAFVDVDLDKFRAAATYDEDDN